MSKQFWKRFSLIVAAMLMSLLLIMGQDLLASATTPLRELTKPMESVTSEDMQVVTSLSQLKDIESNEFYYTAIKSMIERHRCLTTLDGSIRPNVPLNRGEYIHMLTKCLDRMNQFLSETTSISIEDFSSMQEQLNEIATEVASMRR